MTASNHMRLLFSVAKSFHPKISNCRFIVTNVSRDHKKTTKMSEIVKWDVRSILDANEQIAPYALIILNRKILFEIVTFQKLWNEATIRVLVDGGANHWLKFITENKLIDSIEKPHFSTGDMDSISDESKQRLQTMNCQQIETPDQDEPDCPKSLIAIRPHLETRNIKFIQILTDFGGRIDHTLSQIDTLFKRHVPDHVNVYLRSHHTLAWLLLPGQHEILVPHEFVTKQFWCSYVAINGNCNVTTNGLKWDLSNETVGFGKIFSTSNTYDSAKVNIHCDNHLFWSMGTCKR